LAVGPPSGVIPTLRRLCPLRRPVENGRATRLARSRALSAPSPYDRRPEWTSPAWSDVREFAGRARRRFGRDVAWRVTQSSLAPGAAWVLARQLPGHTHALLRADHRARRRARPERTAGSACARRRDGWHRRGWRRRGARRPRDAADRCRRRCRSRSHDRLGVIVDNEHAGGDLRRARRRAAPARLQPRAAASDRLVRRRRRRDPARASPVPARPCAARPSRVAEPSATISPLHSSRSPSHSHDTSAREPSMRSTGSTRSTPAASTRRLSSHATLRGAHLGGGAHGVGSIRLRHWRLPSKRPSPTRARSPPARFACSAPSVPRRPPRSKPSSHSPTRCAHAIRRSCDTLSSAPAPPPQRARETTRSALPSWRTRHSRLPISSTPSSWRASVRETEGCQLAARSRSSAATRVGRSGTSSSPESSRLRERLFSSRCRCSPPTIRCGVFCCASRAGRSRPTRI
jgi:hypothetical protein